MRAQTWMMITAFFVLGCRSDADRMAEFCLNFEAAIASTDDCSAMAAAIQHEIDKPILLSDSPLCQTTTACLPCRKGARKLLSLCGTDPAMRPVLDQMHFSNRLQETAQPPEPVVE